MGNEHSKTKAPKKNGKIPEKHENGSANGLSANVTSNGLEIGVNSETIVQQNGGPLSLDLATESTEPDYVIVESDSNNADAPAVSEIAETVIQEVVEEVKTSAEEKVSLFGKMFKKKAEALADVKSVQDKEASVEDQTDLSPPATDPQPESDSNGDEAATVVIAEHRELLEYLRQKATQTDRKTEEDISTQTGDDDDDDGDTTTNTEGPVDEAVVMDTAANEESAVVIAEEVVEETTYEEPLDIQTAGTIIEEVILMKNNVYENMVFRAQLVEVTDNFEINHMKNYDPEGEDVNGCEETEPQIAAEPESNPKKSIIEDEIVAEENNIEESVPLEVSFSLPKVVADCVEAVFATVSESTDFTAVNTSEPSVEIITEDNGEGAGGMSADVVLIETAEPESNAVTPEAGEANDFPSLDEVPVMETISEVDDVVAVEDVPPINEEFIILEAPSMELITIEELPEDTLNSLDDEVKPESIPEVTTDDNAEVDEDVIADVGPETAEEAEPSPVLVKDDTDVIPEAAIDALSQEFELCAITPREPAVDNGISLEEEFITATTFVPLSGEQEASLTIPKIIIEMVAEEMNEEAIEDLSNEIEAVPESVEEDTTVQESSTGGEVNRVASSEEITEVSEDVLAQAGSAKTPKQHRVISEEPVEENPSPCEEDATIATLEKILESVVEAIPEELEVTENIAEEPADEQADVSSLDTEGESEPCDSVQEELVEENVAPAQVLLEDADEETAAPSAVAVEEETDSNPVISEEPAEESVSLLERQPKAEVLVVIHETTEDEVTEQMTHETVEENSEDSQIATSDEPFTECVEAVLETIVEEIITEDVVAECNLVTSEEVEPEIIAEGETEETAENESSVNSTDSTLDVESAEVAEDTPVTCTDMRALLVELQSACTSVVEDSAYRLCGGNVSSLGYSITVIIHVAPKEGQQ